MTRTFIWSFPCASDLIASDSLFFFSCDAVAMGFNDTRVIVIHERQTPLFFNCLNYSLIHGNLLFMTPIILLNCLFAEWTRYLHITRIKCIKRAIDGQTPFPIEPPLKCVFPEMYGGNTIDSTVRSILNAFSFFKFGTTDKRDDNNEQK